MLRKSIQLAAALSVVLVTINTTQAAQVALSIKFGNSDAPNIVSSSAGVDAAGTGSNNAGVYTNWNTMINKTTLNGVGTTGSALIAGNMVLSSGAAATGVKVDGWKDNGGVFTTPSASGFDLNPSFPTPTGSAGDVQLMSIGPRMNAISGAPSQNYGSIKLSGLSSIFPNGFTVRSYQAGYQPYVGAAVGSGSVYVSATASDFTTLGLNSNYAPNAIATLNWNYNSFAAFTDNYFVRGYYATSPLITGQDMIVITNQNLTGSPSNQFSGESWTGIQIVGEVAEAVPEPATWALGLIGLVGVGCIGLRRKFRQA